VRVGRRGVCLRATLVLLLALIVPCTHVTAQAAPISPVAGAIGGAGEYDHLDTAPRTPARSGRRAVVAPAPPSSAGRRVHPRSHLVPTGPPPSPRGPRSVVLRC
jgi:hypothetical protein